MRPRLLLAIQAAAVVAALGCALVLAARHPWRLDLTPERRFTLSPWTREALGRVDGDVHVTAFYSSQGGAQRREMADLLGLYADAQPRIRVEFLDLDRNPGAARRLDVSEYGTAVVEAGARREPVPLVNEETLTAALLAVAGTPRVATWFVVGHGEHDPRDAEGRGGAGAAARALAAEGFDVRVLEGAATLPDAGLVVFAGPKHDLVPAEEEALAAFVSRGGDAIVLADPGAPPAVVRLLARFGIELAGDVVVDDRGRLFGTDGLAVRVAHLNETLVPRAPDARALLPEAQSLRLVDRPGVQADYLAITPEDTWADVDRRRLADAEAPFRPGKDRRGPVPIAAFARIDAPGGREGHLLAVGDADFVTNPHLDVLGNRDLLLAAASLTARAAPLTAARPPAPPGGTFSPLALTAREARAILWGTVLVPSALLAATALLLARRARLA